MPTGYTAGVGDGKVTDFTDFALSCARAFGALITMRDDSADAPIPDEFSPSTYNADAMERAAERIAGLQAMTTDEIHTASGVAFSEALAAWRKRQREQAATQANYEAMLDKVLAWEPPTLDHAEMKNFMVQQLHESIRFDCGFEWPAPNADDYRPNKWLAEELRKAEHDLEYHGKRDGEERERAQKRTAWVQALKESLGVGAS